MMELDKDTIKARKRYDRFSRFYDVMEFLVERNFFRLLRQETLSNLSGNILEIGVGTGKNIPYYSKNANVVGIDISPKMLGHAKKYKRSNVDVKIMDAQHLTFKDDSFDYVIGTFVLCSIPDPVMALKEIRRVLKKGGKVIFIEHVLSKHILIALWEQIHNPITSWLFGFNVNRDTRKNLLKSGFVINSDECLAFFDVFRRFTCN